MLQLASYLKRYWNMVLIGTLLMLIEVGADLVQPVLMARIIDRGITQGDISYIIHTGLIMLGVALIGLLGGFGAIIASSVTSQNFGTDLRSTLFAQIQGFSFDNLARFKTSSLITRLTNDVTQVQNAVLMSLRIMIRAPLLCIGGIILAVTINASLSLILIVVIPLLGLVMAMIMKKGFPLFALVQEKLDRINGIMRENLAGIRVVKAFVRGDAENKRFNRGNKEFMETTLKASRIFVLAMPLIMLIMNISIVGIIWFGGRLVNQGDMLVGEVAAFINYMMQILFSLLMVAFIFVILSRSKASAERIREVLETETDIRDVGNANPSPPRKGEVVFDSVSFSYEGAGGEPVLQDISLTIKQGETVAILGGTGAGKSTLVSLIPRLYDVSEGKLLIDGQDVRSYKLHALRSAIGVVLQESILFSGTIGDNIRWGKENASQQEVETAARMAEAHDFIMSFPEGYDTLIGQRGVNLSGGQKQRLAIARALIKQPIILILDDSTSAIDLGTEAKIQAALRGMDRITTLVIAQRISSVLGADTIIVLDDGRIAAKGTHRYLMESSQIYQDIYQSQLGKEGDNHV